MKKAVPRCIDLFFSEDALSHSPAGGNFRAVALYFSAPIPPTNSLVTRRTSYLVTINSDLDSDSLCKPEMPNFLVEGSYDAKSQ